MTTVEQHRLLSYREGTAASRWTTSRETSSMERRERASGAAPSPRRAQRRTRPEARSDAPKSFAGSLLVPADMLPPASPPDEDLNGERAGSRGRGATPGQRRRGRPGVGRERRSPEPVPRPRSRPCRASLEVHAPANASRRCSRADCAGSAPAPGRLDVLRRLVATPRWLGALRLARLLALAALTGAVVVTAVIATRPNTAHPSSASALGAAGPLGCAGERVSHCGEQPVRATGSGSR